MKTLLLAASSLVLATHAAPPLVYVGDKKVTTAADGGLRPVVGVHNIQVYRSNRTAPTPGAVTLRPAEAPGVLATLKPGSYAWPVSLRRYFAPALASRSCQPALNAAR